MRSIFEQIERHAMVHPEWIALADGRMELTYLQLILEIERISKVVAGRRIGLLLPNGCAWAVVDLATQRNGSVCVPMPSFFSDGQLRHLIADAGLELILTDQPMRLQRLVEVTQSTEIRVAGSRLFSCQISPAATSPLPNDITIAERYAGQIEQLYGEVLSHAVL